MQISPAKSGRQLHRASQAVKATAQGLDSCWQSEQKFPKTVFHDLERPPRPGA